MKYILLAGCLLFTGCSQKKPVELKSDITSVINKNILLDKHYNIVPLDKSFKKQRYSYIINTRKRGSTFFDNDILVKSFYLLHHANLIVITGNIDIANDYMLYLMQNGVLAPIKVNKTRIKSNKVIIDTIHYSPVPKTGIK
jgi:hypothetical protein